MVAGSEQGTWGNGEGVKSSGRRVVGELPFRKQRVNLRGWRRHVSSGPGPHDGIFSCSHLGSLGVGEEKTDGWGGWTDPKPGNYQVDVAGWQWGAGKRVVDAMHPEVWAEWRRKWSQGERRVTEAWAGLITGSPMWFPVTESNSLGIASAGDYGRDGLYQTWRQDGRGCT